MKPRVRSVHTALSMLMLLLFALGLLLAQHDQRAHAATTFTVQDYSDGVADKTRCPGSTCRLRDAIAAASSSDQITFGSAGHTIKLTQGELSLNKDLTIFFNGAVNAITLDAQSASRVFNITSGTTATLDTLRLVNGKPVSGSSGGAIQIAISATLTLSNIDVETSQVQGSFDNGGAIYNAGTLTVSNFAFFSSDRTASFGYGGALYNAGTATLTGSVQPDGSAGIRFLSDSAAAGGAIYNNGNLSASHIVIQQSQATNGGAIFNNAMMTLDHSLVVDNQAPSGLGGGVLNGGGRLTISDSELAFNQAADQGGGLLNSAALTIQRSLIYSNTVTAAAGAFGGGLFLGGGGTLNMTNSTLSTNAATWDGGGLYADVSSRATLNNVTITKNTADSDANGSGDGGGIANSGMVTLTNSIIAANLDLSPNPNPKHPDCSGALTSQGYNLLRIDAGCGGLTNGVNGDLVGTASSPLNALLADLADNGGPTLTHALLPGSPAINAGNPVAPGTGGAACARLDQRGYPRGGAAGRCDMGAFERLFLLSLPLIVR